MGGASFKGNLEILNLSDIFQSLAMNRHSGTLIVNDGKRRVLAADFEDTATGGNHPVIGVTPIYDNTWYHAAAAYDGTNFKIYLNDVQDGSVATTATPRSDSIQHAAIGTALGSGGLIPSGQTQGFFQGQAHPENVALGVAGFRHGPAHPVDDPGHLGGVGHPLLVPALGSAP